MARAYSLDLRERVIATVRSGQSRRQVEATFGLEPSTVVKWWQRYQATGNWRPGLAVAGGCGRWSTSGIGYWSGSRPSRTWARELLLWSWPGAGGR
jgi:hypothetical protein